MITDQTHSNPDQLAELPQPPIKKRLSDPEVSSLDSHPLVVPADPLASAPLLKELVSQQLDSFVTSAFLPLVAEVKQQLGVMNLTHSNTVATANYAMQQIQQTMQSFREEQKALQQALQQERLDSISRAEKLKSVAEMQHGKLYSFEEDVKAGFSTTEDVLRVHQQMLHPSSSSVPESSQRVDIGHLPHPTTLNWGSAESRIPSYLGSPQESPSIHQNTSSQFVFQPPQISSPPVVPLFSAGIPAHFPSNDSPNPIGVNPSIHIDSPGKSLSQHKIVPPPPMLDISKCTIWKRDFLYWRDLYSLVEESVLFSTVGLHANAVLKPVMIRFTRETRGNLQRRTIRELVNTLDSLFEMTAREKDLRMMDRVMECKRDRKESIAVFWSRFEGLLSQFDHSMSLSPEVLFMRSIKALNLTASQRAGILTFLECRNLEHSISNLKLGSLRLYGQYTDISIDTKNDQEAFLTEEHDPISESYVLRRKGKGPSRNRPGNEVSAIRKATLDSNIPNDALVVGKGGLRCYRCGREDHVVRDCPLPFTKILAYAPQKGSSGKKPSGVNIAETFSEEHTDQAPETDLIDSTSHNIPPIEEQYLAEQATESPEQWPEPEEEAWIGNWFQDETLTFMAAFDSDDVHTYSSSFTQPAQHASWEEFPLIDSGAAKSVCGVKWLTAWTRNQMNLLPKWIRSPTLFKFGSGQTFPSLGKALLTGTFTGFDSQQKIISSSLSFMVEIVTADVPF